MSVGDGGASCWTSAVHCCVCSVCRAAGIVATVFHAGKAFYHGRPNGMRPFAAFCRERYHPRGTLQVESHGSAEAAAIQSAGKDFNLELAPFAPKTAMLRQPTLFHLSRRFVKCRCTILSTLCKFNNFVSSKIGSEGMQGSICVHGPAIKVTTRFIVASKWRNSRIQG